MSNAQSGNTQIQLAANRQGLGVFATGDINKGEVIYFEEPSIRGHPPPLRMTKDVALKTTLMPGVRTAGRELIQRQ